MVAPPWPDYHYAPSTALVERAWHLLTVLLRLGRPAPAAELASRCVLESGVEFVEILCNIPGSPLMLTDDGFVTPSDVTMVAFLQFLSTGIAPLVPRFPFTVTTQMRACGEVFMMYTRKRKLQLLEDDLVETPTAKRRLLLPDGGDLKEFGGNKEHFNQLCVMQSPRKTTAKALQINHIVPGIPNNGTFSVGSFLYENLSKVNNHKFSLPVQIDSAKTASAKMFFNKIQPLPLFKITSDFQINKKNLDDIRGNANLHNVSISNGTVHNQRDIGMAMQNYVKNKPAKFEDETDSLIVRCSQSTAEFPPTIKLDLNDLKDLGGQINHDQNFTGQTLEKLHEATTTKGIFCQSEAGTSPSQKNPEGFVPPEQTDKVLKPSVACQSAGHQAVHNYGRKSMKSYAIGTSNLCGEFYHSTSPRCYQRDGTSIKDNQESSFLNCIVKKQKMKKVSNINIAAKYKNEDPVPKTPNNHLDSKLQPKLESFIIEEEEGSGGYGTVYRARRKNDGKIFAVKCPHANAPLQHVHNEMRMLARFGGRNFVIKYEGSFKSGNSDCFVLEHVEHDRPEVLKKEITIFELQWYGYCMFRALVSLHKQGIAHRDVKPGNFLFSRQHNKGYLIDFNLASDLHQKFFKNSKTEIGCNIKLDPASQNLKSFSPKQPKRVTKDGILVNGTEEVDDLKSHPSRISRKKTERNPVAKIGNKSKCCNKAADISGVTSARDPTSTKTPVDKLKQPIPCKGRKELINFLHEAMQTPDHKGSTAPASQRKRVAAPLGKVERRLVTVTPMPLHFDGNAVAGACMLDPKKNGKHKREGPCVGTKGFRAPEVLFKSSHQGCKVDVWSAGVTLLYLMMGKTPFGGDPEQNIKDIAKLKGSEDLWEVAKIHNTESSFPQELYDVRWLRSLELKEWCILNTRRPEFIEAIPDSLFDLVNKCLTINPRCRIAADEALAHEFFAPCHESLRRQRMLRREAALP
ncbi:uncharacterized protein LOC141831349 [Curcuma longa]|uniref:uncharacterized protein LOC141831349 n=1 Tax=Curcuma longa TaxID=136217 RepID=UPI003D9F0739